MSTQTNIGDVFRLDPRHESGAHYIQVESFTNDRVTGKTGKVIGGDFLALTATRGKTPVRHITISKDGLTFQFNQEIIVMAKKKIAPEEEGEFKELTYELDADAPNPNRSKTAAEQVAEIRAAADLKAQGVKDKEAAKEKAKDDRATAKKDKDEAKAAAKLKTDTDKRVEKFKTGAVKAGLTVTDAALQYSTNRTKNPAELTLEEANFAIEALKEIAKEKVKADALTLRSNLTADEAKELGKFESLIEKFLPTFQTAAFQIGGALQAINIGRLYRASHKTFADYVSERFDLSRPHAYSVMAAAQTFQALSEGVDFKAKDMPSITAAEAIHRGVQGLLKSANVTEDAEIAAITRQLARNVYDLAVQNAPKDKDGKPILSPGHLTSVFSVLNDVARSGVVELDGEQIDINLAAASIDEMITNESAERVKRAKQYLHDQIVQTHEQVREAKGSRLDAALNSATGNGVMIQDGIIPKLTVICSVHGKVELTESSDADIKVGCGCVFVSTPEGYLFYQNPEKQVAPSLPASPTTAGSQAFATYDIVDDESDNEYDDEDVIDVDDDDDQDEDDDHVDDTA